MNAVKRLFTFLHLKLAPMKVELVTIHPDTVALHARLDSTEERLDAVLHRLKRGLASKSERPHLSVVPKSE